jgi:hypothetical protein
LAAIVGEAVIASRVKLMHSLRMAGHGTVRRLIMEGGEPSGAAIEWTIRLALLALSLAAVWIVFGDEVGQFLGR